MSISFIMSIVVHTIKTRIKRLNFNKKKHHKKSWLSCHRLIKVIVIRLVRNTLINSLVNLLWNLELIAINFLWVDSYWIFSIENDGEKSTTLRRNVNPIWRNFQNGCLLFEIWCKTVYTGAYPCVVSFYMFLGMG